MTSGRKRERVTLLDIARAASVAPSTVSNALNGRGRVDSETVERIRALAAAMGYAPNHTARRLRTGRSGAIALFSATPFSISGGPARLSFMMEIAASAATAALESGLMLTLVPPLDAAPVAPESLAIDAAIVLEPAVDDPYMERLRRFGLPTVAIGAQPGREDARDVDLRSGETMDLLLDHLAARGARRIGLITSTARRGAQIAAEERYAAFAAAHGQRPHMIRADEAAGQEGGAAAAEALLRAAPEIDALLVPVDAFAVGAVEAARRLGRAPPDDLMIATRYDGPLARECDPPLTAVDLRLADVADLAVKLVVSALQDGDPPVPRTAPDRPVALIPRRSTGAA